jgi:hypothetical protein
LIGIYTIEEVGMKGGGGAVALKAVLRSSNCYISMIYLYKFIKSGEV